MIVILSIIAGIGVIVSSFSLIDDFTAKMVRREIKVYRRLPVVSDLETLYYIKDYDVFNMTGGNDND